MRKFAYGILIGLGSTLGAIMAAFLVVAIIAPDRIPAPAISKIVHIDEKLRFIHDHEELDPRILAVGSSIAWRQVAGEAFVGLAGGPKHFFNGAAVYMQAHQTRKFARFLTGHFPNVQTLLVLTNLPDFEDCEDRDPIFNQESASQYAFRRWPAALFYLQYFAPRRYLNAMLTLPERKQPYVGDLYMDKYGSGPVILDSNVKLGLRYDEVSVDRICVYKMAELSQDMTHRGIRTMIVFAPIHPEYLHKYPQAAPSVEAIAAKLKTETADDNTVIVTLHDDPHFAAEDFYDAFHLQWPAAIRLSHMIASVMEPLRPRQPAGLTARGPTSVGMSIGVPPDPLPPNPNPTTN